MWPVMFFVFFFPQGRENEKESDDTNLSAFRGFSRHESRDNYSGLHTVGRTGKQQNAISSENVFSPFPAGRGKAVPPQERPSVRAPAQTNRNDITFLPA